VVLGLADGYAALRAGTAAVVIGRDVVRVSGPDAVDFLQGQLSQDLSALAVGASGWSLILQPQGKVDALVRVSRLGDDEVLLDSDGGWGEAVLARLARFKLRVKADLEPWGSGCVRVLGRAEAAGPGVAFEWPPLRGVDLLGAEARVADDLDEAPAEAWEVLRIEAGFPAMGAELTDKTIPAEAGIVERTVSFTKGCFTGQELVARIDSRGGNVPRHLRGLVIEGAPPPPGTSVAVDGRDVGTVTSAARHPDGHAVALGYLKRDVAVPVEGRLDGGVLARISALPLLS
jgi:folate-binding protein YgfZ